MMNRIEVQIPRSPGTRFAPSIVDEIIGKHLQLRDVDGIRDSKVVAAKVVRGSLFVTLEFEGSLGSVW